MFNRIFDSKVLVGACLGMAFGTAGAADVLGTLSRVDGAAFVSQGARYVEARQGMSVKSGQRLMVAADGSAIIDFADGCRFTLADGAVLNLGESSPCDAAGGGSDQTERTAMVAGNEAVGGTTAAAPIGGSGSGGQAPNVINLTGLVVTGVAFGGLVGAAIFSGDNEGDGPSPE